MGEAEQQALSLNWVFGGSLNISNSVVNLSDGYSERVCYLAAHTAIIFDKRTRRQIFLQGHCNAITCLATNGDRSMVITADIGQESLLVLWSSKNGLPLRSVPRPHRHGTCALDVSPDGKWLVTVGAPDPVTAEQEIALWSLDGLASGADAVPLVLTTVPAGDPQICVRFNINNQQELISNGRRRVYFWSWQQPQQHQGQQQQQEQEQEQAEGGGQGESASGEATAKASSSAAPSSGQPQGRFRYYSPPLRSKDFKQQVGNFVQSVFVPGSVQALTATSDGDLVVWDEQGITAQLGTSASDRRAIKLMRMHNTPLTLLATVGDYVVTGGEEGYVRFFDPLLRIVAWFEDVANEPVTSVAFAANLPDKAAATEAADTLNRFMVPDFVVSTRSNKLVAVASTSFEEFDIERRRGQPILDALLTDAVDLQSHPTRPELAVLGRSGTLQRWDTTSHVLSASRTWTRTPATCFAYSRDGSFIVLGFEGGHLSIVDAETLQDLHTARNTSASLVRVASSTTGLHVAVADSHHQVLMYALLPYRSTQRWEYVGKSKSHHGPIVGLVFGETPAGQTRLFSMGRDGRMVEYSLERATPQTGMHIVFHQDLPQAHAMAGGATPTALCFAPPLPYYQHFASDTHLLVADDSYKVRLYNPDARAVQATHLGPTFGGPVQQLVMFRSASSEGHFLAYSTDSRVVGLLAWPLDGDPAQTMGLIAHPGGITAIAISYDGRKLMSMGRDGCLNVWDISTAAMEAAVAASAARPDRWARVLGDPSLLHDLKDYFYLAQIRAQGEDAMEPRRITGRVPVEMVPDLMRAAGYYPSNSDITNLMHHVQFLAVARDVHRITEVGFEDLLRLYINHRPLASVTQDDIAAAFALITTNGSIPSEKLASLLKGEAEALRPGELAAALEALTGHTSVHDAMPQSVDAAYFATDILGFDEQAAG